MLHPYRRGFSAPGHHRDAEIHSIIVLLFFVSPDLAAGLPLRQVAETSLNKDFTVNHKQTHKPGAVLLIWQQ
jgi:hypothetical protein